MDTFFPYKNTYEYLNAIGVLDNGTELEIEAARKEFRRLYVKHYQKKYDRQHARITLCFSKEKKQELQKIATSNKKKTATYLKEIIFKSLKNSYTSIVVANEKYRQIEILVSLSMDNAEELIFEYPQFERDLKELIQNLSKIEQILQL